MAVNPLAASVPTAPIADADGTVTNVWRGFFLAMMARTGGGAGASTGNIDNALTAETAQRIAADAQLGAALAVETVAREAADALEQANRIAADAIFAESRGETTIGLAAETAARTAADANEATARTTGDVQGRGFAFFMGAG